MAALEAEAVAADGHETRAGQRGEGDLGELHHVAVDPQHGADRHGLLVRVGSWNARPSISRVPRLSFPESGRPLWRLRR
ncbi:hypothetical protein [Kitasatospora sp. NPDC001175]